MRGIAQRIAQYWPRRAPGLPPGQRRLSVFPRFADQPLRPPPAAPDPTTLLVTGTGVQTPLTVTPGDLDTLSQRRQRSDFHCVTTWTFEGLMWTGVALGDLWKALIVPALEPAAAPQFVTAYGADGHRAVFVLADLLAPDVMIAQELDDQPLDGRHGSPLRLVSPSQYGYKSVKHLNSLTLHDQQPKLGTKEHLRARVHLEERHSRLPAWLVRIPYRTLVPITALLAERSAQPRT